MITKTEKIKTRSELIESLKMIKPPQRDQIGAILLEHGVINTQQLAQAVKSQIRRPTVHLGTIFLEMGVSQEALYEALAQKFQIPYVSIIDYPVNREAISVLPEEIASNMKVIPIDIIGQKLVVAMENPLDTDILSTIQFHTNLNIETVLASQKDIQKSLDRFFSEFSDQKSLHEFSEEVEAQSLVNETTEEEAAYLAKQKPIVKLLNTILLQAVKSHASDINLRPETDRLDIYYRIDGKEHLVRTLSSNLLAPLVSRIKIISRMNIAERRMPQDGHAQLRDRDNLIDLRVSCIPTVQGESIVIRILNKDVGVSNLEALKFPAREKQLLKEMLSQNHGIILITGPTGSGKSTTMYSLLHELRHDNPHIITVEDPVEYQMEKVEQIQIAADRGYTFAHALRQILRHDPDVILVGEIRDVETAEIASRAALTGHLVISTLHTNDAASTITRLTDMGIEPYLLSSTLLGVVAQRLVRLNCQHCKEQETLPPEVYQSLNVTPDQLFYAGKGCSRCNDTGYLGRTPVLELLPISPRMRQSINAGATTQEIQDLALEEGMIGLTQHALSLARQGLTSLKEVYSVRIS